MSRGEYLVELDEKAILKLPYVGPPSRRIYVMLTKANSTITRELFVQKSDAFTTDLADLIRQLKNHEISEIRYQGPFDGSIRIYLGRKKKLSGEYSCALKESLDDIKRRLEIT